MTKSGPRFRILGEVQLLSAMGEGGVRPKLSLGITASLLWE